MPLLRHLRIGKARRDDQSGSSPGQTPSSRVGGSTATQTKPTLESRPDAAQPPDSQVKGQGDTRSTTGSTFAAHAETTLKEAAEKLQKKLPEEVQQDERFRIKPIHGSADINAVSDSLQRSIGRLMDQQEVPEQKQILVKALTNNWVKKAIPFIHSGLSVAEVQFSFGLAHS